MLKACDRKEAVKCVKRGVGQVSLRVFRTEMVRFSELLPRATLQKKLNPASTEHESGGIVRWSKFISAALCFCAKTCPYARIVRVISLATCSRYTPLGHVHRECSEPIHHPRAWCDASLLISPQKLVLGYLLRRRGLAMELSW